MNPPAHRRTLCTRHTVRALQTGTPREGGVVRPIVDFIRVAESENETEQNEKSEASAIARQQRPDHRHARQIVRGHVVWPHAYG
jgi:hypothetical protein